MRTPRRVAISVYDNTYGDWELFPLDFSADGNLAEAEYYDYRGYLYYSRVWQEM